MSAAGGQAHTPLETALEGYQEESQSALLYQRLAEIETDARIAAMYRELGHAASAQAALWSRHLERAGRPLPVAALDRRARLALWLAEVLGTRRVRGMLAALKVRGVS
ncbi:MAG: hypothetical protein JSW68_10875, partial [Burkholderiales bacterium]